MKKLILILSLSFISVLGFSQGATSALQRSILAAIQGTNSVIVTGGTVSVSSGTVTTTTDTTGIRLHSQITYTNSSVVKASAGTLIGGHGYNSSSLGQFILFFNSTTVPANGTAPYVSSIYVPALSTFAFELNYLFPLGISWSNSSTSQTKTIGSSDIQITFKHK